MKFIYIYSKKINEDLTVLGSYCLLTRTYTPEGKSAEWMFVQIIQIKDKLKLNYIFKLPYAT